MHEVERNLLQQLSRTSRCMFAAFETRVGHPLPRLRILAALQEQKCSTQKELVHELHMDPGALTRQMKSLESDGLVNRYTDLNDNRLTRVQLTPAGQTLYLSCQESRRAFLEEALKDVPQQDIQLAMTLLKELETRFARMHTATE